MTLRVRSASLVAALLTLSPTPGHAAIEADAATSPHAPPAAAADGWQDPAGPDGGFRGHPGHPAHGGWEAMWILHHLNLSTTQHEQIRTLLQSARTHQDAARDEDARAGDALIATPPNDPSYPGRLAAAQQQASARVQARAALWAEIYALLTPAQQAQIPGLVQQRAADRAAHRAHRPQGSKGPHRHSPPDRASGTPGPA